MGNFTPEPDIHTVYIDEYFRYDTAIQMNILAHVSIDKINQILKITELEDILQKMKDGTFQMQIDGPAMLAIIQDDIFDKIRMVMCIENYFKAILLIKGFLVHQIKPNQPGLKPLYKKQKTTPIKTEELFQPTDKLVKYNDLLSKSTINMSWILQSDYVAHYQINNDIIDYIRDLNTSRNALHFNSSAGMRLSDRDINMIKNVRKIIKCDLAHFQNSLIQHIAPYSPTRLYPECD